MDCNDQEKEFRTGRMDFVFRQTGLLESVSVDNGEPNRTSTDYTLYEGLRKELSVLNRVVEYVPYETVKEFVLAYKECYFARRDLGRAMDRLYDAESQNVPDCRIGQLYLEMMDAENRQEEAERAYQDSRFDELRMVMYGKRIRFRYKAKTEPTKESTAEKAGIYVAGAVGGLWFGFLAISLIAVLLFGLANAIRGCKWTPSEYDAQKLEYLP